MKIRKHIKRRKALYQSFFGPVRHMCKPEHYDEECISCRTRRFIDTNGRWPKGYEEVA